jgi:prepilin-type N-terminal cleavage/methylation domain-containing protein
VRARASVMHAAGRRAFTLVEMLVVIVVVGLLVAIAAPRIDVQKFRVNAAMRAVGTTLLAAQRFAVTRQHDIVVAFDTAANALRIVDDVNNNNQAEPGEHQRVVALDGIVFGLGGAPRYETWPGPVSFTRRFAGLPAVTFRRDGSASQAGAAYLTTPRATTAPGHGGDTRAIVIDRATARVSWYRASPPAWQRGF